MIYDSIIVLCFFLCFFFFNQKTAYDMRISDWSSDVCSSDLLVSDHDIHTMIKAIRNVMGVAKIRKEEKSSKRKTGDAKRTASSKFDADTLRDRKSVV